MLTVYIDFSDVVFETVGFVDTDGASHEMHDTFTIPVCIPVESVGPWLAAYDPTNQYSPSAADSRVIARAVLDALKKAAEEP